MVTLVWELIVYNYCKKDEQAVMMTIKSESEKTLILNYYSLNTVALVWELFIYNYCKKAEQPVMMTIESESGDENKKDKYTHCE